MDHFWNNIYDEAKDRRYGSLFLATLFLGLPLLALVLGAAFAIVAELGHIFSGYPDVDLFQVVCLGLMAGLAVITMALLWRRSVRTGRQARRDRLKFSNLSRDELLKARLKLKGQMDPVGFRLVARPGRQATIQTPNTDLKY